jgi:hypothetical protein
MPVSFSGVITVMRHSVLLALGIALLSVTACAPAPTTIDRATYKAVPLKGDPIVTFNATSEMLLIDITSPTGIGGATIEKLSGQWPPKVVMRLHVKGLESFTFRYAATIINGSVSSHGDNAVREESSTSGTLQSGDPNWIVVTPGEGYFDLEAPPAFLQSGENRFTIAWIDFYR